ncbi:DNA topoisomerase [Ruminococcus gauvreauii]|uniref:DNA topoisomerase n=1 Tax=Ruminococcus gauvreauii TaxID=438033 RepID=A0ABY5VFF3_9FIRM|nr:DNA topoisomerase [Ruminococcus gauvreauii]UWP59290.1 DNA topoisomerase [Ruminococcus gauvreauii]
MAKSLYIAEKPSVAQEFAKALKINARRNDGYLESEDAVVTWCVGHLVTMSYPEEYDEKYKRWRLETLPFLPSEFKYEVIPSVKKQYDIVSGLLRRPDITTIYVCTDSGREGEYIYRLVEMMANVKDKDRRRVWIDSQTEEEILRGIREAKDLKEYDNLAASAYLRAKEDYLMGINFSRLLSLKYGNSVANFLGSKYQVISVGRVMTCVLGMVVRREREIRDFVKTPFYRLIAGLELEGCALEGEWRVNPESLFFQSPALYKENGFREEKDAKALADKLSAMDPLQAVVLNIEKKKERKNPPLLYNLAELQNECSRLLKTSPDETLRIVQELYERKLVTYPRTDARVLSSAVAKVIAQNLRGLRQYGITAEFTDEVLQNGSYQGLAKTRYVNDRQITDHYAIIPTGQGISGLAKLPAVSQKVYELVVRRFLSIFYPPAQYRKLALTTGIGKETFFTNARVLLEQGYLKVIQASFLKKKEEEDNGEASGTPDLADILEKLKKNQILQVRGFEIKEGETAPPKRYNSGSIILAMENAGQLIEDEELRAQIKGSGIGTSATRAEILKKLVANKYMALNKKTQILTPTMLGEMIFDVVNSSIRSLLNPELTASWEKGLTYVAEGSITEDEYMQKLEKFITDRTTGVLRLNNQYQMRNCYQAVSEYYQKGAKKNG